MSDRLPSPAPSTGVGAGGTPRGSFCWALGASLGVALGFAVFAFVVPLAGVSYYVGAPDEVGALAAAARAGALWLLCAGLGALVGLALALALGRRGPAPAWLGRAELGAFAVYLLCLRGGWGRVSRDLATATPGTIRATPLPAASWALPLAAAVLAAAAIWFVTRGSRSVQSAPRGLSLAGVHLLCSLTAAHLTVQLAYYVSRTPLFFAGLGDLVQRLAGR